MPERDYSDSPFAEEAREACPWRTTDHRQPGAYNGSTYCTWCEGFVAGAEAGADAKEQALRILGVLLHETGPIRIDEKQMRVVDAHFTIKRADYEPPESGFTIWVEPND